MMFAAVQKHTADFKIIQPGASELEPKRESFNRIAAVIPFTHLILKSIQV